MFCVDQLERFDIDPLGLSLPVQSFASPYVGSSVQVVMLSFNTDIIAFVIPGYMHDIFIILEEEEDDICTMVSTFDDPPRKMCIDFEMALAIVQRIGDKCTMEEGLTVSFKRHCSILTRETYTWASDGGTSTRPTSQISKTLFVSCLIHSYKVRDDWLPLTAWTLEIYADTVDLVQNWDGYFMRILAGVYFALLHPTST